MIGLKIGITLGVALCTGLLFLVIYGLITKNQRYDLDDAADIELEELKAEEIFRRPRVGFLRKKDNGVEDDDRKLRMMTDSGKELKKLNRKCLFAFLIGTGIGLVGSVIYIFFC